MVGGPVGGAIGSAVGDVAGTSMGADAGDDVTGEEESMAEDMRVWDTSPKEQTRDYNPNDFAQMFNKIKDIDQAKAATRADNPLKRESIQQPTDSLTELTSKLFADYQAFVSESKKEKKAKKDYDGDGKIETNKDEVWGSRAKAAAKAGHPFKEAEERTMSKAAKGVMKYGKDGMQALAKAGKEGKSLDKVRDKYNKYDESAVNEVGDTAKGQKMLSKVKDRAKDRAWHDPKSADDRKFATKQLKTYVGADSRLKK
jgi:hypothetical protein